MNFDQDEVVVGAGAGVNKIGRHFIPSWLRPPCVSKNMVAVWMATPDVEKIQRVVACGDFVRTLPQQQLYLLQSGFFFEATAARRGFTGWVFFGFSCSG